MTTDEDRNMPFLVVAGFVLMLVTVMLWGWAAAMYQTSIEEGLPQGRGRYASVSVLVHLAIVHLQNIPEVTTFVFTQKLWYVLFSLLVLGLTCALLFWMHRLHTQMESGTFYNQKGKVKAKLPRIRIAKPLDD